MKLILIRETCGSMATQGRLFIQGVFECFTLEDTDREMELYPDAKVPGETCIPRGTYQIIIDWSNRFQKEMPRLLNVPGFEGIRIHMGNTAVDTHGCLLVGEGVSDDKTKLYYSRLAYANLMKKIEKALDGGEEVWIEIK